MPLLLRAGVDLETAISSVLLSDHGNYSIKSFLSTLNPVVELQVSPSDEVKFQNLNTPVDWERFLEKERVR
jgi:molybdopterin-guanine dinucleotide biosynthesis protein A